MIVDPHLHIQRMRDTNLIISTFTRIQWNIQFGESPLFLPTILHTFITHAPCSTYRTTYTIIADSILEYLWSPNHTLLQVPMITEPYSLKHSQLLYYALRKVLIIARPCSIKYSLLLYHALHGALITATRPPPRSKY